MMVQLGLFFVLGLGLAKGGATLGGVLCADVSGKYCWRPGVAEWLLPAFLLAAGMATLLAAAWFRQELGNIARWSLVLVLVGGSALSLMNCFWWLNVASGGVSYSGRLKHEGRWFTCREVHFTERGRTFKLTLSDVVLTERDLVSLNRKGFGRALDAACGSAEAIDKIAK